MSTIGRSWRKVPSGAASLSCVHPTRMHISHVEVHTAPWFGRGAPCTCMPCFVVSHDMQGNRCSATHTAPAQLYPSRLERCVLMQTQTGCLVWLWRVREPAASQIVCSVDKPPTIHAVMRLRASRVPCVLCQPLHAAGQT